MCQSNLLAKSASCFRLQPKVTLQVSFIVHAYETAQAEVVGKTYSNNEQYSEKKSRWQCVAASCTAQSTVNNNK
jgi:hypothetical protein